VSTEAALLRESQRRYTARYRRRNPEAVERDRLARLARHRALTRLANLYPEDYARLRAEEMRRS